MGISEDGTTLKCDCLCGETAARGYVAMDKIRHSSTELPYFHPRSENTVGSLPLSVAHASWTDECEMSCHIRIVGRGEGQPMTFRVGHVREDGGPWAWMEIFTNRAERISGNSHRIVQRHGSGGRWSAPWSRG